MEVKADSSQVAVKRGILVETRREDVTAGSVVTKSCVPTERHRAEWSALCSGRPGDAGETSVSPHAKPAHHLVVVLVVLEVEKKPRSFDHADPAGHEGSTEEYSNNPKQLP
jgi:hypothetical protein